MGKSLSYTKHDYNGDNLEINDRKISGKSTNIWELSDTCQNNPWVKEEIKRKIRKYFKENENKNRTHQNVYDVAKGVFRHEFIALNTCIKKKKGLRSMTSTSTLEM